MIYVALGCSTQISRYHQIGDSLFDAPGSEKVASLIEKAKKNNVKLVFPVDYITADKFDKNANVRIIPVSSSTLSETFFGKIDGDCLRCRRYSRRMDGP